VKFEIIQSKFMTYLFPSVPAEIIKKPTQKTSYADDEKGCAIWDGG